MPVTGLPAAAEAALTSLLQTHGLLSWKVVNEGRPTVVVLRFQPDDEQPFSKVSSQHYRRKPPSQRRRDLKRHITFQQRYEHFSDSSQSRSTSQVDFPSNCYPIAGDRPNATDKDLNETQSARASVPARNSCTPSVSSACVPAVSGLNEDSVDPIVACTETAENVNRAEIETEKDEGNEVTLEVVKEFFQKMNEKMEEDARRYVSAVSSAIHGTDDSFPSARPSSPPPATEELGASSPTDALEGSPAAPVQPTSRTERSAGDRKADRLTRRGGRRPEDRSPIRRFQRSNYR